MPTEICSYRLTLRGKPLGSFVMSTSVRGRIVFLEAKLLLQGSMGNVTVTQRSKCHRTDFYSLSFQEETQSRNDNRQFSMQFDSDTGLVRANKSGDVADMPYTRPFLDPLSLLHQMRHITPEATQTRVPMIGKDVIIERVQTTELNTAMGKREAYEYQLHPGGSYAYVDVSEPHHILMLSQRVDGQLVDATLVRVDEEADAPQRDERRNNRRQQPNRKRRPRREGREGGGRRARAEGKG
jgi:hypothetical protein